MEHRKKMIDAPGGSRVNFAPKELRLKTKTLRCEVAVPEDSTKPHENLAYFS